MLQPLHQISWLKHIRCYHKSTLPLSEDCALVILLAKYYFDHSASVPVLLPTILYTAVSCTAAHGFATATAASVRQFPLHLCCCWSLLPTLHLHCNSSHHVASCCPYCIATQLLRSNWSPNSNLFVGLENLLMLKLPLPLTSAPSLTSALLQQLPASRTVAHLSVPSFTGATLPCLSHCCNLLDSCCLGTPSL